MAENALPSRQDLWGIPNWVWIALAISGWLWAERGHVYTIPNVTFGQWIVASMTIVGTAAVMKFLPFWAVVLWFSMLSAVLQTLDQINDAGKERLTAMHVEPLT